MKVFSAAAILITCSLAAAPALAGQHERREGSQAQPAERAVPREESAPRESAPPPSSAPAETSRTGRQRQPETPPRNSESSAPARSNATGRNRTPDNLAVDRAIPRTEPYRAPDSRIRGTRPTIIAPRYYNSGRYYNAPYYGYRPYSFRPYTRINYHDVYLGYSVPYMYSWANPIPVYGWGRPAAPVMVGPASPYYGGVSLELWPNNAEVWVDGTYAGWVEDFDGTMQPLTLMAGTHRIEVYAPGYEPLVLDVLVRAGEVVPYRGSLVRRD